jgi:hypothetical protein
MKRLREIREELLASVDRWIPEIQTAPARPTLRIGIAQKCYSSIDQMLDNCVREALALCGATGRNALTKCGNGKPANLLTLGQRVEILVQLDEKISIALTTNLRSASLKRPILGKEGASLLRTISRKRNYFTHKENETNPLPLRELLCHVTDLCESQLISAMITAQEANKI